MSGMLYNERAAVIGKTRSGKSELLNVQFSALACQRVLIDTKDEFAIDGVEPVSDPAAIDWDERTIHYVDSGGGAEEFDELFAALGRRRRIVVCVHELADLCEHRPGKTGRWVSGYFTKGGAHGRGALCGTQRPVNVPPVALTEADHMFYVVPRLAKRSDHQALADALDLNADELAGELTTLHREKGPHSYLWWNRREQQLTAWDPLPEQLRARNIVARTTVA